MRLGVVPARRGGSAKARFPPWMGVAAPVAAAYFFSGSRLGRSGVLLRCVSQVTLAFASRRCCGCHVDGEQGVSPRA